MIGSTIQEEYLENDLNFVTDQIKEVCLETQERVLFDILSLLKTCDVDKKEMIGHIVQHLSQDEINLVSNALLTNFPEEERRRNACLLGANISVKQITWLFEKIVKELRED